MKLTKHLLYGELQSFPMPKGPRKDWTLNFITDLPLSLRKGSAFDAILVIVNRYIKYSTYIPVRKDWDAKKLADVIVEEVFSKFGIPVFLVSDQGSLFTLKYYLNFCYYLWVRLNYSTAFYPQTNGQTERQNQTLEQYLRCYVNYQQDDWVYWLLMAKFIYNNSVHSMT